MRNLNALHEALADGLHHGALIHEKTGAAHALEVVAVEHDRVMAVARMEEHHAELYRPEVRVRMELPREASVVYVPGRILDVQRSNGSWELEIHCPEGAESRQRRMDVRVDAQCRIRLGGGDTWDETRTVNISAGGALVVNGGAAHPGDRVDVEMELDGHPLHCRAEVVRRGVKTNGVSSRTNAALRFLDLPEGERERLALYVLSQHAAEKAERPSKRR